MQVSPSLLSDDQEVSKLRKVHTMFKVYSVPLNTPSPSIIDVLKKSNFFWYENASHYAHEAMALECLKALRPDSIKDVNSQLHSVINYCKTLVIDVSQDIRVENYKGNIDFSRKQLMEDPLFQQRYVTYLVVLFPMHRFDSIKDTTKEPTASTFNPASEEQF